MEVDRKQWRGRSGRVHSAGCLNPYQRSSPAVNVQRIQPSQDQSKGWIAPIRALGWCHRCHQPREKGSPMKTRFVPPFIFLAALCGPAILPFLLTAGEVAQAPKTKSDGADEKTIGALIADLGDDSFDKRDNAHKRLLAIGGPAVELLRKAVKNTSDFEARERAAQLAEAIQELGLVAYRVDFRHDFRKELVPNNKFVHVGSDAAKIVKTEPDGLRITLPTDEVADAIGVRADFAIKGDFDVTVNYELIKSVNPAINSTGFDIYLVTESSDREALTFKRSIRPNGQDVYVCNRLTTIDGRREDIFKGQPTAPAKGKSGYLRIVRVGPKVVLSVQEENANSFRVVHRVSLGEEDVKLVRLSASSFAPGTPFDVRFRDIRIRCAEADGIRPMSEAKANTEKK
jgi:hypothetical protein